MLFLEFKIIFRHRILDALFESFHRSLVTRILFNATVPNHLVCLDNLCLVDGSENWVVRETRDLERMKTTSWDQLWHRISHEHCTWLFEGSINNRSKSARIALLLPVHLSDWCSLLVELISHLLRYICLVIAVILRFNLLYQLLPPFLLVFIIFCHLASLALLDRRRRSLWLGGLHGTICVRSFCFRPLIIVWDVLHQ